MRMVHALAIAVILGIVAGCATPQTPPQEAYTAEATYVALAKAELAYETGAGADPVVIAGIKAADQTAYDAVVAARKAAEAGDSINLPVLRSAANSAVAALSNYLVQKGIAAGSAGDVKGAK